MVSPCSRPRGEFVVPLLDLAAVVGDPALVRREPCGGRGCEAIVATGGNQLEPPLP